MHSVYVQCALYVCVECVQCICGCVYVQCVVYVPCVMCRYVRCVCVVYAYICGVYMGVRSVCACSV